MPMVIPTRPLIGLLLALTALAAWADRHGDQPRVAPVDNALYQKECGSCHFAYQPGLLPAPSWRNLMSKLDQHFGENAELPGDQAAEISAYLTANAGANSKLVSGVQGERISTGAYFQREHRKLGTALVSGNPAVTTFSNCPACHQDAAKGGYRERAIHIPGHGPWDD